MKKISNVIWGVVLIAVGVIFAVNALGIADINVFFDGWWTLFIIIPCAVGLFTEREKTGNIIGLCIGVFLLLCCRDILEFDILWKLLVPAIIIIIGLRLVFGNMFGNKIEAKIIDELKKSGKSLANGAAVFSGQKLNFSGEVFEGAELNAVFGGIDCDLRNAIIEKDCVIEASAIFGGIDIFVPYNVKVKVKSTSLFGGVSDKTVRNTDENAVTVYINATCMFGGIDIK